MPLIELTLGTRSDTPMVSAEPFVWSGYNIRVRSGRLETIGLFGPVRTVGGAQITLPGSAVYRSIFTTPSITTGQILTGSTTHLVALDYDPTSTPATGRRWRQSTITPAGLPAASDTLTDPSSGRVAVPPAWWFADQDDLVVCQRSDVLEGPYIWDRVVGNVATALAPSAHPDGVSSATPIPQGAVAGGILNRILVLFGAQSFTDPDPLRYMTIRWSDRFDYGQWTPWDTTTSGELTLEGGSRIVGGGVVGFGAIAWTDKRMALLTETFDNQVFSRRYIDGGRGLLANRAWVEADGQVWWLDENRTLNVFDGGRPRQLINTNKTVTVERLSDVQVARIYLTANPEFGEIIISYPRDEASEVTSQIVYNYLFNCWYPWSLSRACWHPRVGVIRPVAVDGDGAVWQHEFDVALPPPWAAVADPSPLDPDDVEPYDWSMTTNLITQENPGFSSWASTKLLIDTLPAPANAVDDSFDVTVIGYREPNLKADSYSETQSFDAQTSSQDYRVGGKAIQLVFKGTGQKTVWRFGKLEISGQLEGER